MVGREDANKRRFPKIAHLKLVVLITYLFMVAMNILSNALPFYGRTAGEVSAMYETLFTPAGFTFSIWGLIYLMLLVLILRLLRLPATTLSSKQGRTFLHALIASSLLNSLWLLFWHRDNPLIALTIIALLLLSVLTAYINRPRKEWPIDIGLSLYLGWLSVATIANLFIAFSITHPWFETLEPVLFILTLIAGFILAARMVFLERDAVYALVFLWAYFGIFIRHLRESAPWTYLVTGVMLFMLVILVSYGLYRNYQSRLAE